ncbi:MAG TPA: hypothetical protein PKW98_07955 [Candidatus Wallbacteria bacterium]|nr:hypothetical protein [Candidatus Wallbacteria bacterium]
MIEFQMMTNAVFFGAVPALIALYMLKLNRRNKKVPSVHFIKDLISDNKGSSLLKSSLRICSFFSKSSFSRF